MAADAHGQGVTTSSRAAPTTTSSSIDLTNKNVSGKIAARALDKAGIELNYNSVPYDTRKPFDPSGIRLGSPVGLEPRHGRAGDEAQIAAVDGPGRSANPTDDNGGKVLAPRSRS